MTHPRMYDDADPVLARLRRIALAFPEAREVEAHGRPTFRTSHVFAQLGGGVRGASHGDRRDHALLVRVDEEDARALLADPRGFSPAYLWPHGWVGVDLDLPDPDGVATSWREVAELVDASYRRTAPARALRALEELAGEGRDPVTLAPDGSVSRRA